MQHFTVIHDGSDQGWQAAYLAFHIATLLGAPLRALLTESPTDKKAHAQRAAQIEVGGRAAGVAVESRLISDFSVANIVENCEGTNGLFIPRRLVPNEKTAHRFLEALSCPLWLVSMESAMDGMVMLISDSASDEALIHYAMTLSGRIQLPLTGFVHQNKFPSISKSEPDIAWQPIADFTPLAIATALKQVNASLLFLSIVYFSLVDELPGNCVIYPAS
jgi:hypothetical protein